MITLDTFEGYKLNYNSDSRIVVVGKGNILANEINIGDTIRFLPKFNFGANGNFDEGLCIGWMVGDGSLLMNPLNGILRFAKNSYANDLELIDTFMIHLKKIYTQRNKKFRSTPVPNDDTIRIQSKLLGYISFKYGLTQTLKHYLPPNMKMEFYIGFLKGIFSADGCVYPKGKIIKLYQTNKDLLLSIQECLMGFNIYSRIGIGSKEKDTVFSNGTYYCKTNFVLDIIGIDSLYFIQKIGFLQEIQKSKCNKIVNGYSRSPNSRSWVATVKRMENLL